MCFRHVRRADGATAASPCAEAIASSLSHVTATATDQSSFFQTKPIRGTPIHPTEYLLAEMQRRRLACHEKKKKKAAHHYTERCAVLLGEEYLYADSNCDLYNHRDVTLNDMHKTNDIPPLCIRCKTKPGLTK